MKIDTYWWGCKLTAEDEGEWDMLKFLFQPDTLTVGDTYEWHISDRRDRIEQVAENITLSEDELTVTVNR